MNNEVEKRNLTFSTVIDKNSVAEKIETTKNTESDSKDRFNLGTSEAIELLNIWKKEKTEELKLKKVIVSFLMRIIYAQLIFIAVMVALYGWGIWDFEEWTFRLIILSIFVETIGGFIIVVKSLFPEDSNKNMIDFMEHVYGNIEKDKNK